MARGRRWPKMEMCRSHARLITFTSIRSFYDLPLVKTVYSARTNFIYRRIEDATGRQVLVRACAGWVQRPEWDRETDRQMYGFTASYCNTDLYREGCVKRCRDQSIKSFIIFKVAWVIVITARTATVAYYVREWAPTPTGFRVMLKWLQWRYDDMNFTALSWLLASVKFRPAGVQSSVTPRLSSSGC